MNRLELVLTDLTNSQLKFYLEDATDAEIRADIEEIKRNAAITTDAGKLRQAILDVLNTKLL